ncbi:MAG: DUF488 domain-containing protein [Methanoregula sp.]|jgi:uncharacterized protein (DUF488 family)
MTLMHLDAELQNETGIVTLGYEGRKLDQFLQILKGNNVRRLIDVRNNPFSLKPGYSKNQLEKSLEAIGVSYLHLPELGIESRRRRNLSEEGLVALLQSFEQELDSKGASLNRIKDLAKKEKVALMCFEADVTECHRSLIAKKLRADGIEVVDLR